VVSRRHQALRQRGRALRALWKGSDDGACFGLGDDGCLRDFWVDEGVDPQWTARAWREFLRQYSPASVEVRSDHSWLFAFTMDQRPPDQVRVSHRLFARPSAVGEPWTREPDSWHELDVDPMIHDGVAKSISHDRVEWLEVPEENFTALDLESRGFLQAVQVLRVRLR